MKIQPICRPSKLTLRWFFIFVLIGTILLLLSCYIAGDVLTRATHHKIAPPQDLHASAVTFQSKSGATIHGWLMNGTPGTGALLLLHPVRSDRSAMLGRAKFFHKLGYTLLLIDLQAHGESSGERITFGVLESKDVEAAVAFLKSNFPGENIGAIGVSLGGAAITLASPLGIRAIILESVYPTIEEALKDRLKLHLGILGPTLVPVLLAQLPIRLGISPEELRPIDHIADIGSPLLLISGANDEHTTAPEAKRLFAAARFPKEMWIVDGAAHVDLHRFARKTYEEKAEKFFSRYLGK